VGFFYCGVNANNKPAQRIAILTTSISELVYTTKARAEGVRKRTDDILYSVLADCLLVAERCAENPDHQVSLRVLF
jgi:hypothetical protein